jgi:methyl-accepting chemotaxis protein
MSARLAAGRRQDDPDTGDAFTAIARRVGGLGVEIADLSGLVADLSTIGATQSRSARTAISAAEAMHQTTSDLSRSMQAARDSATETRTILGQSAAEVTGIVERTALTMKSLSDGATSFMDSLGAVDETLRNVQSASAAIQQVARETKLLALNASVEAARAGDAGRGFAVIAVSVKELADQVQRFSAQNTENLATLTSTLRSLLQVSEHNAGAAREALAEAAAASGASDTLHELVETVGSLVDGIDAMTAPVEKSVSAFAQVETELKQLVDAVEDAGSMLETAKSRSDSILDISEDCMRFVAQSGIETPDTPIIDLVRHKAAEVADAFEAALGRGEITMAQLFDEAYQPVKGSDPAQFTTAFVRLTDRLLPPIQEPVLDFDTRIVFCAAVDRNGYLPTHNLKYNLAQGDDPVWNATNCRNRRMFNDRTGLGAGRNTLPFLLQTYRRDMGGGVFALMKDCSAPITVRGRHWGGLRIAFKV